MMPAKKLLLAALVVLAALYVAAPVHAQSDITLITHVAPPLNAEALRASVEAELQVPTTLRDQPSGPTLQVDAEALSAVRVTFARAGKPTVERTLDVSAQPDQASSIVGLVASNLVRDEAGELLAQLSAANAAAAPPPAPAAPPRVNLWTANACRKPNNLRRVIVGADFLPMVGMSIRDGVNAERNFSFNLIGGLTGAVRGLELGGVFNIDRYAMCGAQLAGVFNFVGGDVAGAQFSQLNIAGGNLLGAQFSQVNIVGGDALAAQLGLLNLVGGHLIGAQLGLTNVAADGVAGLQYGLVNVGVGNTDGAQLGLVNVTTQRVNGAMVGLVNVAEDADAAVGLVNVIWNGRAQLDVWGTDAGLIMAGATQGAKYTHNVYGIGIKPMGDAPALATALGLGVRPYSSERITVDIDAMSYGLFRKNPDSSRWDATSIHQLRVPVGFAPLRGLWVWVAPTLSVSVTDSDSDLQKVALFGSTRLTKSTPTDVVVRMWPGASVGVRFF